MILDRNTLVSNAQAVTATAVSTDTIDLGAVRDIGTGTDISAFVTVDVAATAAGAATVTFAVITSANADLSSATTLYTTAAIGKATLVAGYKVFDITIPKQLLSRYLGLSYTVATGPLTAGAFTGGFVVDTQSQAYYDSNLNISGF